ncbi:hypothetical protein OGAPHI_001922 [Ogataea philodendri]|uniref:Nuclear distribution protein PAC1 n=1 Tax=Ogataea philodendri TaxID=1378263 RepID=A0A9P8P9F9_9ASCO|nr:uncharacterized protein OGAPHI_001922 [Ogataea philodendri]KAH3668168.1 hypothetical protein OGAPHI_001922 [Ogataea philodendri]
MEATSLSDRQRSELNKAVIQYLERKIQNFDGLARIRSELGVSLQEDTSAGIPGNYLEKKWATVVRLQRRIYDLEKEIGEYKELVENYSELLESSGGMDIRRDKLNWLPTRAKNVLKLHKGSVTCVSIHPYEPLMATGSQDGTIALWNLLDLSEPEKVIRNAHTRTINSLVFQSSEITLESTRIVLLASCSSDLLIKLWDCRTGQVIRVLTGHDHLISGLRFNPADETQLLSCSRDKTVKKWDVLSGWCLLTIRGHSDWVRSVDVNATGQYILSCSNDQSVRLTHYDTGAGISLCLGHEQVVEDAIFLPMEANEYLDPLVGISDEIYNTVGYKYCVSGGRDCMMKIWLLSPPDLANPDRPGPASNPKATLVYESKAHSSWIRSFSMHPNGYYLASCADDKLIKIWDLRTLATKQQLNLVSQLKGHENFVNAIKFAPPVITEHVHLEDKLANRKLLDNGIRCYLASVSADDTIRVWV